jgi:hypothetical protein
MVTTDRMNSASRRSVLFGAAASALSRSAIAQTARSTFRIGVVSPAASKSTLLFDTFRARLRELGYVEDLNIVIEFVWPRVPQKTFARWPLIFCVNQSTSSLRMVRT